MSDDDYQSGGPTPPYKQIRYWVKHYGDSGSGDQRGVDTFVDVEPHYLIQSLRNELYSMSRGNYNDESLHQIVGKKRMLRYGSYAAWAKMMLLWFAAKKA